MPASSSDLALAERAARETGALLLERFRGPASGLGSKSSSTDPVSDADRDAETLLTEIFSAERPEDGLLGEEGAGEEGSSGRRWVVDPLDGTVNFLYGHPLWCVSVALEDAEGGLAAAIFHPPSAELFAAERGGGTTLNGQQIRVREPEDLASTLVATGFSYSAERRSEQAGVVARVLPSVRDVRRGGAAALDLAWVAAGRVDAYYERGLEPWDWAAGRLLVEEAGGEVQQLSGEPAGIVASAPALMSGLAELVDPP